MINIAQEEFIAKAKDDNYQILDVRRPDEWATGIVENATTIDFLDREHFLSEIEKLDKNKSYLIYCRSGNRSGKACMMMDAMGFRETFNLVGGMLAWKGDLSI